MSRRKSHSTKGAVSDYLRRAHAAGLTWERERAREMDDAAVEIWLFRLFGRSEPSSRVPIDLRWAHRELRRTGVTLQQLCKARGSRPRSDHKRQRRAACPAGARAGLWGLGHLPRLDLPGLRGASFGDARPLGLSAELHFETCEILELPYPSGLRLNAPKSIEREVAFDRFKEGVLQAQIAMAVAKGARFAPAVAQEDLAKVEGNVLMKKGAATKCRELLAAARAAAKAAGKKVTISAASGYRDFARQDPVAHVLPQVRPGNRKEEKEASGWGAWPGGG